MKTIPLKTLKDSFDSIPTLIPIAQKVLTDVQTAMNFNMDTPNIDASIYKDDQSLSARLLDIEDNANALGLEIRMIRDISKRSDNYTLSTLKQHFQLCNESIHEAISELEYDLDIVNNLLIENPEIEVDAHTFPDVIQSLCDYDYDSDIASIQENLRRIQSTHDLSEALAQLQDNTEAIQQ